MSLPSYRSRVAVRREYERLASAYDRIWGRYLTRSIGLTLDHLCVNSATRVLDVGCGTGLLLDRLKQAHPRIEFVGVDLTTGMLVVAQRRLAGRASLLIGDAAALPFPDGGFDVVVSSSVLHYLPEPLQALAEWRRILDPGGRFVLTDWSRDFATIRMLDFVLRRFNRAHGRAWSVAELREALVEVGFSDVEVSRHRQGWFWGMMAVTARN